MNKYIKLALLNISIAMACITIYSPGLLALYPTDISIMKAGCSILSGIGLLGAFGYGNFKILNSQKRLSLTTNINDMEQAKKILTSYKNGKYFNETACTALEQINRINRSVERVQHEINRKFTIGTLSNDKYMGIIGNANQVALDNIIAISNRMQLFDETEYERLQNYKEDNIPDDIQEKQISLYQQNLELITQAISANEHLILQLDTLAVELAKPGEQDDSTLKEIERLTQEVKYYA